VIDGLVCTRLGAEAGCSTVSIAACGVPGFPYRKTG